MSQNSTIHLSNTILNKLTTQPIKNSNNIYNTCYRCTNCKPKCVCWI